MQKKLRKEKNKVKVNAREKRRSTFHHRKRMPCILERKLRQKYNKSSNSVTRQKKGLKKRRTLKHR